MKLQMPSLDAHPFDRALWFAKRHGLPARKMDECSADMIMEDWKGENPPSKSDLIGAQKAMIGRNSSHEWWAIMTLSGRRILWVVGHYDDESEGDSWEVIDSKDFPSYVGHV